ncbi:hypothetical protein [Streptomyces sp. NPDC051561]|uniref:hypothetical protein n=1 Tax=Streptomyces sp. NPDC051561 TaxID=3365658 RepID=UPI0037B34CA8
MTEPAKKTAAKKTTAQKAEALAESTSFEFNGITYTFGDFKTWPLEVLETEDEIEATRLILGEDQWSAFRSAGPTIGDFFGLAEAMSAAKGEDADSGN